MEHNLGKVGMTADGAYVSTKAYEKLTCVLHNGLSWISTKDVPAGYAPAEGSEYWQKVSEKGEKGDQGERGPQGNSAFDGNGVEIVNNLTQGGEAAVLSAEQGKVLNAEIAKLSEETKVIKVEDGSFLLKGGIRRNTGTIAASNSYIVTDFVDVTDKTSIEYSSSLTNADGLLCVAFYDAAETFISGIPTCGNVVTTIPKDDFPKNAAYVRLSTGATATESFVKFYKETPIKENLAMLSAKLDEATSISDSANGSYSLNGGIRGDGTIANSASYKYMDYFDVTYYTAIEFSSGIMNADGLLCVAYYDADKVFISGVSSYGGVATTIQKTEFPINTKYVRLCTTASATNSYIKFLKNITIKEGLEEANDGIAQLSKLVGAEVGFRKVSDNVFYIDVVKNNRVLSYKFERYRNVIDGVTTSDMWNNNGVYLDSILFAEGNTNFISSINGFVGVSHGCEVMRYVSFNMDGKEFDFDNTTHLDGKTFRLIIKSDMYMHDASKSTNTTYEGNFPLLDTNGNPLVMSQHTMEIIIDERGVVVDNSQRIIQNNISFDSAYGAMLELYYGSFSKVMVNNDENTINEVGISTFTPLGGSLVNLKNTHCYANKVMMYGKDIAITQEMDVIKPKGSKAGIYFFDYPNSRLKAYFQPIPTSTLSGGQEAMVFNEGDVIRVKNTRTIDF